MHELIEEARVLSVDALRTLNLSGTKLEFRNRYDTCVSLSTALEPKRARGFVNALKALVFEDTKSETKQERELTDATYALATCLKCKCVDCVSVTSECTCRSCVYGTHTVDCVFPTRIAEADPDVLTIKGYKDLSFHIDTRTGKYRIEGNTTNGVYESDIRQ